MVRRLMDTGALNPFPYKPPRWAAWIFIILLSAFYMKIHTGSLEMTRLRVEEIHTANAARAGSITAAIDYSRDHDPGGLVYNVIAATAVKFSGFSEPAVRFPALLFGALCIPALFILLRRLAPDGLSIIAPVALFFSPPFLFVSMTARDFSLFILIYLIALTLILGLAKKTGFRNLLFCFIAIIVLSCINGTASPSWMTLPHGFPIIQRILIIFVAATGGVSKANLALAAASVPIIAYGAVHLRRARRNTFVFIVILCLLISTAAFISTYSEFGCKTGFTILLTPLLSVFSAAALYYYFITTFRRDATGIYSVGLFVRMALTGLILFISALFFAGYTARGISDMHFKERENWREPLALIAEKSLHGDSLIIPEKDFPAAEYFLNAEQLRKLRLEKPAAAAAIQPILEKSPRSWIILRDIAEFKNNLKSYENFNRFVSRHAVRYGGILDDLLLIRIDGYLASSRLLLELTQTSPAGDKQPRANALPVTCPSGDGACSFNIYIPKQSSYRFRITASDNSPIELTVCGEATGPHPATDGKFTFIHYPPEGACAVEVKATAGAYPILLEIARTEFFTLIPFSAE